RDVLAAGQQALRARPIVRGHRLVAGPAEHLAYDVADRRVVLDHEHEATFSIGRDRDGWKVRARAAARAARQVEPHGRAAAELAEERRQPSGLMGKPVD